MIEALSIGRLHFFQKSSQFSKRMIMLREVYMVIRTCQSAGNNGRSEEDGWRNASKAVGTMDSGIG